MFQTVISAFGEVVGKTMATVQSAGNGLYGMVILPTNPGGVPPSFTQSLKSKIKKNLGNNRKLKKKLGKNQKFSKNLKLKNISKKLKK